MPIARAWSGWRALERDHQIIVVQAAHELLGRSERRAGLTVTSV